MDWHEKWSWWTWWTWYEKCISWTGGSGEPGMRGQPSTKGESGKSYENIYCVRWKRHMFVLCVSLPTKKRRYYPNLILNFLTHEDDGSTDLIAKLIFCWFSFDRHGLMLTETQVTVSGVPMLIISYGCTVELIIWWSKCLMIPLSGSNSVGTMEYLKTSLLRCSQT